MHPWTRFIFWSANLWLLIFSSVQFSHSVVSNSLRPHESQHARPPCSSPTPGVHSNSHPSSWWCHPAISSSVVPSSSCPQSLLASVFSSETTLCMRWPKYWSFSFRIIPSKEHPGLISFRMDWLDLLDYLFPFLPFLSTTCVHFTPIVISPHYACLNRSSCITLTWKVVSEKAKAQKS